MVDAVGSIAKIVDVALKIKKAADTVKQNEDVCKQINDRVEILSTTLSQHQNNNELIRNSAVRAALEALDQTLGEALKLVMDCQEETNFVCLLYTARNLSQQLVKVEQRISNKNMDAMFAIMGFLLPKGLNQNSSHPPSPQNFQVHSSGRQGPSQFQAMQPPNPPKEMLRQNHNGGDVNVQTEDSLDEIFPTLEPGSWDSTEVNTHESELQPATSDSQWDSSMDTLCSCCAMVKKRKPVRQPSFTPDAQPRSLLHEIAEVALNIKVASETVLQYKEDCIEISKRVSRVSALLSQLENTEMTEEQAMKYELAKLLYTFLDAHTLVMICQRSGIVTTFVCSPPCKLSKQLSSLLDQLVPQVNAIIAVIVNCTLRPKRYTRTRNVRNRPRASQSVQPARCITQTSGGAEATRIKFGDWE